jgi:hypothetical protein
MLLFLSLVTSCWAQSSPRERVEAYFRALKNKRADLALKAFGLRSSFSESEKAVLKANDISDFTPVGQCEVKLATIGEALASYDRVQGGYPADLKALVPNSISKLPRCPTSPQKDYWYSQTNRVFYKLSCPTGHGRTKGLPMYTSVDGLIPNPRFSQVDCFQVMKPREEGGLTRVKAIWSSARGRFERDFTFTPLDGFVFGAFSREVEEVLRARVEGRAPRGKRLDTTLFLLGLAALPEQGLVKAAHCKLRLDQFYYKVHGVRARLGEKSFDDVVKHLDEVPVCPVSKRKLQLNRDDDGNLQVYCPGHAHSEAGLERDRPCRKF